MTTAAVAAATTEIEMPDDNAIDTSRKRPLDNPDDAKDTSASAADQNDNNASSSPPTKQAKVAPTTESSSDNAPKPKEKKQKKPEKPTRNKKTDPEVLEVRRLVQNCCRTDDLHTAITAYDAAVAKGIRVEAQTFYNLLNLCDGLSDRGVHIGTPKTKRGEAVDDQSKSAAASPPPPAPAAKEVSTEDRRNHAFRIKKHMEDLSLPLNEPAYTALIRILSKANDTKGGEELLEQAENCQQCKPKLRLYSPLILTYCDNGDMANAVKMWSRMYNINTVEGKTVDRGSAASDDIIQPSEKEYCALLQCAVKTRCHIAFERVLSEIAEDILVPSADTANAIISWFESSGAIASGEGNGDGDVDTKAIESLMPPRGVDLPSMGPVTGPSGAKWEISRSCNLDANTATLSSGCLEGKQLKKMELSDNQWSEMMKMNESIVLEGTVEGHTSKFQGGRKGPKRQLKMQNAIEKRKRTWESFKKYLANRVGPCCIDADASGNVDRPRRPFDIIIDGANVGYYKQNYANSPKHVDYEQIDWTVSHFLDQGKSVLLVLHERHFHPKMMPKWAEPIAKSWSDKGLLYKTPGGSNDDWFWLHAALWCGRNTLVLTNDEMRDHHFQMLAHRVFLRWKERARVHFTYGEYGHDEAKGDKRRPLLPVYPDIYSRRIQRLDTNSLVVPLAKHGDSNRFLDGSHDADDSAPVEETYLCIQIMSADAK